jgi:hypothetical protein
MEVTTLAVEYKTSLKYSGGHDAPWTTVTSDNEEEHTAALASLGEGSPMWAALGRAQAAYKRDALLGEVLGAQVIPQAAAPAAGQPPWTAPPAAAAAPGEAKYCAHGMQVLATGIGKNGKAYKRYDCPARVKECPPAWG